MANTAHGTLTANVVKIVSVDSGRGGIVIVNRAQTGTIWVRLDGTNPVPEAPDTFAVFGSREFPAQNRNRQSVPIEVRMLADAAHQYSVEAY